MAGIAFVGMTNPPKVLVILDGFCKCTNHTIADGTLVIVVTISVTNLKRVP